MYYLGIDIGKRKHVASMLDDGKKPIFKAFSFDNSSEDGEALIAQIQRFSADTAQVSIGVEATGHYWLALYSFLLDKGYVIHVINPIQTDGWRKGIEIRKRKTDDIDSLLLPICFATAISPKPSLQMKPFNHCAISLSLSHLSCGFHCRS